MMNKTATCFCLLLLMTLLPSPVPSNAMQESSGSKAEDEWTFEIVKETTMKKQEVVLNIKVKGDEGAALETFRNSLYTKDIDSAVFKNTKVAYSFFKNPTVWMGAAELEDFQADELREINEQFLDRVRNLVQSKLDSKVPEDKPWIFSAKEIEEISEELITLELATEASALGVLLPHQQKLVLKEHFSALGWQALDSVYGNFVVGLSDQQKKEIGEILAGSDANRKQIRKLLLNTKSDIQKELWAKIIEELKEDQKGRLKTFRTSFLSRLKGRKRIHDEKYEVDDIVIQIGSFKKVEEGILVAEPCLIFGHYSQNNSSVRDIELFDHSLKGLSLDKLPVVDNQRYLLGIELSNDQNESFKSIQKEFLDEMAELIKGHFETSTGTVTGKAMTFAMGTQAKKTFRSASIKCYKILDESQMQILLENRLGFELFRHGAGVFESSEFCEQLNLRDDQQRNIRELVKVANERLASNESLTKKQLDDLDALVATQMSEAMTQEQLAILDEIR